MRASQAIPVLLAAAVALTTAVADDERPDRPREVGLAERAESRLAQIDVTVFGPPEIVSALGPEDFRLKIGNRVLTEFTLDRLCGASGPAGAPVAPASYLFYFDQPHLTLSGRQQAMDAAHALVERLVPRSGRAMIVSNAGELTVVEPLTADPRRLADALERLEHDRQQWDSYAELEERRVADVVHELNMNNVHRAISLARRYQREETTRTDRDLRRLALALDRIVDLPPPKALIYFADTTRANSGEHYLTFFGRGLRDRDPALRAVTADGVVGEMAFDQVLNAASAQAVRIYTVEARGLMLASDREVPSVGGGPTAGAFPMSSRVRLGDAHRTLESLATETGGEAFLHGIAAPRMAERIIDDGSCVYLASFDPRGFPEDEPLRVDVELRPAGVTHRTRGRVVFPSAETRRISALLRAFTAAETIPDPLDVRAGLIPTGFDDGRYRALLQIAVPSSPLPDATWDLGASLVLAERVREHTSGRIGSPAAGLPVILEREVDLPPGAWEIVAVAQENTSGLIASRTVNLAWPRLRPGEPAVGPMAVLQPGAGAFSRAGTVRTTGSLLLPPEETLDASRPAAFVGLVCGPQRAAAVIVERELTGPSRHGFPHQELEDDAGCVQLRDVVPSNTLRAGTYRYDVRLVSGDQVLASGGREVVVVETPRPDAASP